MRWANGKRHHARPSGSPRSTRRHDDGDVRRATLAYVYEGLPVEARPGARHPLPAADASRTAGRPPYETVEEFSGPLVPLAGPKRVEDGFRRHAEALKARCEELAATEL